MTRVPRAKWFGTVVIAVTMAAVSEPVAFGQLAAEQTPRAVKHSTTSPEAPASTRGTQNEQVILYPTEGYFAVFGGYAFGGKFDAEGTGLFNGTSFGNGSLADSRWVAANSKRN